MLLVRAASVLHLRCSDPKLCRRIQDEEVELTKELEGLELEETQLLEELASRQDEQRVISEQDEVLYRKLRDNHRYP